MRLFVIVAGLGQLALAAGSLAIPRVLHWREDTQKLQPLTRQVFWTYAGYIWATNLCFGVLSTFAASWLLDRSPLARAVAGYMAAYWAARLLVQFFWFDRSQAPAGAFYKAAEAALVALFVYLVAVYAWTAVA